jgi:tetraprenyl-beta-curcumene synthase
MEARRRQGAVRTAALLAIYWLQVFPRARSELRHWELRARAIRDPALQRLALAKLRDEGTCAEGVAAFALLAVARERAAIVRLCVAFEVMYDLVDGLGELPVADPLAHNRWLAAVLAAALDPTAPAPEGLVSHVSPDDGEYLTELVNACRAVLATLPAFPLVAAALRQAVERAGEAQSLNHSGTLLNDMGPLVAWAATQGAPWGLTWWEAASAAAAPLGIYALCALASHPDVSAIELAQVETAYFPWIAGLLGILESLVDRAEDSTTGMLSYAGHYGSPAEAAVAVGSLARNATLRVQPLRETRGHIVILAGMLATNLSHHGARDAVTQEAGRAARENSIGPVGPLLVALRLRRRVGRTARLSARRRSGRRGA